MGFEMLTSCMWTHNPAYIAGSGGLISLWVLLNSLRFVVVAALKELCYLILWYLSPIKSFPELWEMPRSQGKMLNLS